MMPENNTPNSKDDPDKSFASMSTNELLSAYDSNRDYPITKMKIRSEILRRMNEGSKKQKLN